MAVISDNCHSQYLAEKVFRVCAISHRNRQVIKAKIGPCALSRICCYFTKWPGLNMKGMRMKVRSAFTDEHIWKNFITFWRADADAMSHEQPLWQCKFYSLVKNFSR